MATLLQTPNFEQLLEHPYKRSSIPGVLSDVYDGRIWKEFKDELGEPFFMGSETDIRIGFSLNVDWFCPSKHIRTSVGAIYLSILNLPRHLRYKKIYTLLVGIIPGPNEPNADQIQNYLEPLVDELQQLWQGQLFLTRDFPIGKMVRCALVLIACDIPAARKVCVK